MIGPARLDRFTRFVQGPVRTGLYRCSRKPKRTARSGCFAQFVQFVQFVAFFPRPRTQALKGCSCKLPLCAGTRKMGPPRSTPCSCRSKGKWRPSYKLSWMLRKSPMIIPGRVRVVVMLASALMSRAQPKAPRTAFPWCCRGEPCRWWCSLLQYFLQTLGPSHVVCSTNCNNAQCMRPSQFVRKRPPPAPPSPPPPVPKK